MSNSEALDSNRRLDELELVIAGLRRSERWSRALFDQSTQHMLLLRLDGIVLELNPALSATLGRAADDVLGSHLWDAPIPRSLGEWPSPDTLRALVERARLGEAVSFDLASHDSAGTLVRYERFHLQPVLDSAGEVEVIFGTGVDLTSIERAQEELKRAWRAAQTAHRVKSEFLSNMSHEIRTPMNAILGFTDLLAADASLTPAQSEKVRTIRRAGEHLLALIDDVLQMSRIEAGHVDLEVTTFDLGSLAAELEALFVLAAADKGLELEIPVFDREREILISTDAAKVRQILINLLGNAIKFTDRGRVRLTLEVQLDDGQSVLVAGVHDTGPGIPLEDLTRVFEPFEQSALGRRTKGGTGLGLTICRHLTTALGGELEVESTVGLGACFTLTVPVARAVTEKPRARRVDLPELVPMADDVAVRVLVVDDDAPTRAFLGELLERVGAEVSLAPDGLAGLRVYEEVRPPLVLMDLDLPELDGYETMRRLRAYASEMRERVCIVVVSATELADDGERALHAGADRVLRKPVRTRELLDVIASIFPGRIREHRLSSPPPSRIDQAQLRVQIDALELAVREEIRTSLRAGDLSRIREQLDAVGDARSRKQILALVEDFDYEALSELLGDAD